MQEFRVSVIVPTFNRSAYIEECLDSLLSQTAPPFEIIVVDDGSEDDTATRLSAYEGRITYLYKTNGGKASAINLGLTKARGDLIWFFDDDDVAISDSIERRIATLRENPSAGFVYAPHFLGFNDPQNRITLGPLHDTPDHGEDIFLNEILKGCFFHLATALIKRDVIDRIGGFDPTLIRAQDYDLQIRMAQVAKPAFCPSPSFLFRQHDGIRGTKNNLHKSTERTAFFIKYDQVIGKKVRQRLEMGEYIIPRKRGELTHQDLRSAYLARMLIMGSKGCIPEMLEDLGAALALLPPGNRLSRKERETIVSTVYTGYSYSCYRTDRKKYRNLIAGIPSYSCTPSAKLCLAMGFFRLARFPRQTIGERLSNIKEALLLATFSRI